MISLFFFSFFFLVVSLFFFNNKQVYWFLFYVMMSLFYFLKFFLSTSESLFSYHFSFMAVDIVSFLFVILSFWVCLFSFISIMYDEFYNNFFVLVSCFSLLLVLLVFFFSSVDVFFFFLSFELSLVPIFFLIVFYGAYNERVFSLYYFFLFTIITSIPLFVVVCFLMYVGFYNYVFILFSFSNWVNLSAFVLLGLILGFMSKLPLFSFHVWLPKAHVDAPVSGSIVLAGVLLNLSGYGLIRVVLFLNYSFLVSFFFFLLLLGVVGYFVTAYVCIRVLDVNVIVAFSSVSHISFAFSSCIVSTFWSLKSSFLMFLGHGLVSPILFFSVYVLTFFYGSRFIMGINGFGVSYPFFGFFVFVFILFNIGFPPFVSFFSEISIISGLLFFSPWIFFFVFLGFFFNSVYIFNVIGVFLQSNYSFNQVSSVTFFFFFVFVCVFFLFLVLSLSVDVVF